MVLADPKTEQIKLPGYRLGSLAFDTSTGPHFHAVGPQSKEVLIRLPKADQNPVRLLASYRFAARLSGTLEGAGALVCRDVLSAGDTAAMVLDAFPGTVLETHIPAQGMRLDKLIDISVALTRALDALHLKGIAHRDLTPDACLVTEDASECRLISLESAAILQHGAGTSGDDLTVNPQYAAPEMTGCMEVAVDMRADLYSLGACLFHMAIGRAPFSAIGARPMAYAHVTQPVPDLARLRPELPKVYCDIAARLLQKDPDDRYDTAHGVLHDLNACAEQFHRSGTVRAFKLAQKDKLSRFEISDKPYGRMQEIQTLLAACNLHEADQPRTVITISGPSGIGKTTVVDRLRVPLAIAGVQFITGKFDQFQRDKPYLAFAEAAANLARIQRTLDPDERAATRAHYQDAVGGYGGLLTELVPQLSDFLGPQAEVAQVSPTEAQIRFNAVVGRFFRAMASPQTPMVMFIDDVQWADHASLAIMEALAEMPGLEHFVLVLGYRSDEVGPGHPAQQAIDVMRDKVDEFTEIEIGPLKVEDVREIMRDALNRTGDDIDVVAELVHGIASGNPFFAREFLISLRDRDMIRFEQGIGDWQFDLDGISDVSVPDSVAGMLTDRFVDMPKQTLDLLDMASCIGNSFDLLMLSKVSGRSMSQIASDLVPAITGSLIVPLGSNQRLYEAFGDTESTQRISDSLGNARYRFRHDQARLAAHDRMTSERRAQLHLLIGRLILAALDEKERKSKAVEIFAHLEYGAELIVDPVERLKVAHIGLQASRASRKGLAFATARAQLIAASALLPAHAWRDHEDLKLNLETGLVECAFALADRDALEASSRAILENVSDPIKTTPLQIMRIGYLGTQNEFDAAVSIAVSVAKTLGVSLPLRPSKLQVLGTALRALIEQGNTDPRKLADLPEASDPKIREAIELIAAACPVAYFSDPNLLPLLGITGTRLSIKHGIAPGSPYCFAVQALIYCGPLNMIERGYKFGELALAAGKRYGGRDEARAQFVFNTFVRHWKHPLSEVAPALYGSWAYNRDAGDHENATYCAGTAVNADLLSGRSVDIDLRHPELADYLRNSDMLHVKASFMSSLELLRALRAPELSDDLHGELHDYATESQTFDGKGVLIAQCAISAGILDFFAGRYKRAEVRLALAEKYEENIVAQPLVPGLAFFRALNAYRLAHGGAKSKLRHARRCHRRLRNWMKVSPVNLAHRVALLDAEDCFVRGKMGDGLLHLNRAYDIAGTDSPMYAFLANSRRAEVLRNLGQNNAARRAATQAIQDAQAWGATAVVNEIRHEFAIEEEDTPAGTDAKAMDLADVLDTVGAIAQEQDRTILLERILASAIQTTNADSGVLVKVVSDVDPQIQIATDAAGHTSLEKLPLSEGNPIWAAAIQRCFESGEIIVSNDPSRDFLNKENDETGEAKSLLCVPILLHSNTFGALCLTNHLTRHVFTPGRARLAQALGSQAGIALENAQLYGDIQSALHRQTAQAEANQRFVPEALLQALGEHSITDVELGNVAEQEMSVVFADIRGFTAIARTIGPERTIQMINRYLSHVQAGIAANGGFVGNYMGDGLLALFPGRMDDALHGAIAMSRGLDGYNRDRGDFPELSIGISVNRGPVTLGMIGDEDHIQCGVLGDAVNICARIETLTKKTGARFLVNNECIEILEAPERFLLRPVGKFNVPGQTDPVELHECYDVYPNDVQARITDTLPQFARAVQKAVDGDIDTAARLFDACDQDAGGDSVARRLADWCRQ